MFLCSSKAKSLSLSFYVMQFQIYLQLSKVLAYNMEKVELEERKDVIVHGSSAHAMCINEAMGKMIVARKIQG